MSHARIQPSSAGVWVHCPGSVTMQERYPRESDSGAEGTACHHAAAMALTGQPQPAVAPNGVVYTDEILDAARMYVDAVLSVHPVTAPHVEEAVSCEIIHPECWGTPDVWVYDHDRNEVHVWDLKYGWGLVEVYENWQLLCYASGVCDQLEPLRINRQTVIVLHIVQPRPFHTLGSVREWRVTADELAGYMQRLQAAATAALGPDPQCITGKHCHYCKARHACTACRDAGYAAMEFTSAALPSELDPEQAAWVWTQLNRAEEAVKFLRSGLEGQIMAMLTAGKHVPGVALEQQAGRRTWNVPVGEVLAAGEMYGVDLSAPAAAITPSAAMKKLPREVVEAFSSIDAKGVKLVPTGKTFASVFAGEPRVVRG